MLASDVHVLHGKVRHSEELRGIYGFSAYQHYKLVLLVECGLCKLRQVICPSRVPNEAD